MKVYFCKGVLRYCIPLMILSSSCALPFQTEQLDSDGEGSENLDLPPWLEFAQLINDRIGVSDDILQRFGDTLKHNGQILAEIQEYIIYNTSKPHVQECNNTLEQTQADYEVDWPMTTTSAPSIPGIEVVRQSPSQSIDSVEKEEDSRILRIREKIRYILKSIKEKEKKENNIGN